MQSIHRSLSRALLLVALALSSSACAPSVPPYAANQKVVSELGADAAKDKLKKLLSQATAPQVQAPSVEIEGDYYHYQALDIAMFGRGFISKKVRFKEIDHTEVWENKGSWYCKVVGEDKLDQLKWSSESDAKEFADLVMSFKAGGG
jgi:hypothetical protein